MGIQDRKRRERELKKELDQGDRRIAVNKRERAANGNPDEGIEVNRDSRGAKPEVIIHNNPSSPGPSIIVDIGTKKPIPPPYMYTRKGVINTPPELSTSAGQDSIASIQEAISEAK